MALSDQERATRVNTIATEYQGILPYFERSTWNPLRTQQAAPQSLSSDSTPPHKRAIVKERL